MLIGLLQPTCGSSWSRRTKTGFPITRCGGMDGDGHFSNRMRPISRSQPTSRKTAWAATFPLGQLTGYTYKVTRSSNRNNPNGFKETWSANASKGELQCKSISWQPSLDLDWPPQPSTCSPRNQLRLPSLNRLPFLTLKAD